MGRNNKGQLGIGEMNLQMSASPILVKAKFISNPVMLACGSSHTLLTTGKCYLLNIFS
jgi:hypothetical protein